MKLDQLLFIFLLSISSSLTAQVYVDLNTTLIPTNSLQLSPGVSIGYNLNNLIGLGAFAQNQRVSTNARSHYNIKKTAGVYYGLEIKGNTGNSSNTGWTYVGRAGWGSYKYDNRYEGAELKVNAFYEAYLGKNINRRFSFGLGWRQSTETIDVFEWAGVGSDGNEFAVFDRIESDVYNDLFLRLAYKIGSPARPTLKKSKAAIVMNKMYLDFFVSKNLRSSENSSGSRSLNQFEMGLGYKLNDDIGVGIGAFMGTDINSFVEDDLVPLDINIGDPIFSGEFSPPTGNLGTLGFGVQLRATPGKWHYKVEIGSIAKVSFNDNPYTSYPMAIAYTRGYYFVNTKTEGFNPYFNLHVGRTFWDAITLSLGYTYAPNINYSYSLYDGFDESSSRKRYHAPQIKLGYTLD